MPLYFNQTKYSSFQRQLHIYNFQRITAGKDKGADGYGQSVEKIESTFPSINSRLEAEAILRKAGVST